MIDELDYNESEELDVDELQSDDCDDMSLEETDSKDDIDLLCPGRKGDDTDLVHHATDEDTSVVNGHLDQTPFTSLEGWDCTCYGSCGCRYYRPKSENDDDCFYCGHHKSDHKRR